MRGRRCSAHAGDSELIAVEVRPHDGVGGWRTEGIFLSAHCFGRSAGRCRWYRGSDLSHFMWRANTRGTAHVWVASGKHANYPSARECDSGHWYYDTCDANDVAYRFPIITSAQNVGSRLRPLPDDGARQGCAATERLPVRHSGADEGAIECFWDAATRFRGWQRDARDGATPYSRVLAAARF
jgi:hypothetical protein